MLYRKIGRYIEHHLRSGSDQILVIEGARQIGKSFIIRKIGRHLYENFVEINFVEDDGGVQLFKNIRTTEEFYLTLSMVAGKNLDRADNTLVFLDEIQHYPQYFNMLKFFRQENRYHFIAGGRLLDIDLRDTISTPVDDIIRKEMFQLDFEEFLIACDFGVDAIAALQEKYRQKESLTEEEHRHLMDLFRRYLLVGGMPDAVNEYLDSRNIMKVREIHNAIHLLYENDVVKYEEDHGKDLFIGRIYEMVPSQMEKKKKRIIVQDIRGRKGDRSGRYQKAFEYLTSSGVTIGVYAISENNLLKLYLNDVGVLTAQLYYHDLRPVLEERRGVTLGAVYENVVAQELRAHGHKLFYYDNRKNGEVDFLIDNHTDQSILPIEVKSGKNYRVYSALNNLLSTTEHHILSGLVLSNDREIRYKNRVTYMPIYYIMFL